MYQQPTSNFPTVVFLVIVFVGMGLLIYRTVDLTQANGQMKATLEASQATASELSAENDGLRAKVAELRTDKAALSAENDQLKARLEQTAAEIEAMKAGDAIRPPDLGAQPGGSGASKLEITQPGGRAGNGSGSAEVLQSSFLPADPEFWTKAAVAGMIAAILLLSGLTGAILNDMRRRKAPVQAGASDGRGPAYRNTSPTLIDTGFVGR